MCETPKEEPASEESSDKKLKQRSYYYDDAHGYEDFDPALDDLEPDEEESA